MIREAEGGAGRRLWRGYTALAARNLPFTAIQFPVFEYARSQIWTWRDQGSSRKEKGGVEAGQGLLETGMVTGASAAASGAFAATLTTPTDVVKTRMMLSAGEHEGAGDRRGKSSGLQVAKTIYRDRGIRGLFRGGILRATWTAVGSGLYLGTYEVAKVWLKGGKMEETDDL
jgi:solute carrier family 25 (mitochondrial S-adenosylmethionine transporter), member 26